ncbi:LIM and SH3 domain protein Lasp isoform X1 [Plutella xylostella]|uniref:LIM and SH3 domain protein Lasp isoform X1 n=1 Tax=Plutella xylostella TaxID=51655 RepID=UPI0020327BA9|nr:LIM and SH3 domain protein Lasp isoform X1 [Plutella xylostella]XP_048488382.1 LIM and SH3 domain protein Lasp isoform X1 [Plutella xylostella]XP_048488421.1 LIM and SH3 domain protein Lasp isoform X1 [Plutella xylostella]
MNKTCARCEKTVYPTEELKCLDKTWHKGCFKCQECGMTLNMRTYKGYGKLPYCESHVPKAKHTTMAETPELKRIAENTKLQSNVKYHADFERSKGKFTQVADDPETLRIKANTKIISNVAYHGDLEKKAHMERQRQINENGEIVDVTSTDNYHQQIDNYASEMLSANVPPPNLPQKTHYQTPQPTQQQQHQPPRPQQNQEYYKQQQKYDTDYNYTQQQYPTQYSNSSNHTPQYPTPPQYASPPPHAAYQPANQNQFPNPPAQYSNPAPVNSNYAPPPTQYAAQTQQYDDYKYSYGQYQQQNFGVGQQQKIGRIQDYDPLSDGPRAPVNTQRASTTLIYNSTSDGKKGNGTHQPIQQQSRSIGRVHDLDPLVDEPPPHNNANSASQRVYVAMYDYEANDSDEVSFREGDLISNVTSIDSGWMTGQVLRTGRTGMLPANYVEVQQH